MIHIPYYEKVKKVKKLFFPIVSPLLRSKKGSRIYGSPFGAKIDESEIGDLRRWYYIHVQNPDTGFTLGYTKKMTDATDVIGYATFRLQSPVDTVHSVKLVILPKGTGNLYYNINMEAGQIGEAESTHTDGATGQTEAVTANQFAHVDISSYFSAIGSGDWVSVKFERKGTHANDTVNADVYYYGLQLNFTEDF